MLTFKDFSINAHPSKCSFSSKAKVVRNFSTISGSAASRVSNTLKPKSEAPSSLARESDMSEITSETPLWLIVMPDVELDGDANTRREPFSHPDTPHEVELVVLSLDAIWTSSEGGEGGGGYVCAKSLFFTALIIAVSDCARWAAEVSAESVWVA